MDEQVSNETPAVAPSALSVWLAIPPLPPAFGLFVGSRLTPPGTTEFFGYLYGTTAGEKCDLFTADQMREYARLAIEAANVIRVERHPRQTACVYGRRVVKLATE